MGPTSVKKTQQQFRALLEQLQGKLLKLQSRRETMDTRAFVVVDEGAMSPNSPTSVLDERAELYHGEVGSLVSTATDIIIKALQIKLSYVHDVLERLSLLINDNPRQATPTELSFSHYEEWLDSNQQLLEFNSQLYELERVKFDMKRKQEKAKSTSLPKTGLEKSTASQLAYSQAHTLLDRVKRQSHSSNTTRVYIHELLYPRGGKTTFESHKVQDYIAECGHYADSDIHEVKGVHSERYQEFMGVLCSYIVDKQREWQREDIPYELVYSAVESSIMPQLKSLILRHVSQPEKDDIINKKCHAFSAITMDQLRVKPHLQSNEPVPFIDSITQLRASYFSSTPTDKMYSVVAAVKALYDQIRDTTGDGSIDGDSFLDVWIYVIIKANVKNLATNLRFMIEYGNPQLASGEAGYYLTTLEAAVQFITTLTPHTLQSPNGEMEFVVCERAHFTSLCSMPGSGMELVTGEDKLQGYRIAVLANLALNRARFFRAALVPTANYSDCAKVAVIRVKQENTNPAMMQYLLKQLRAEGLTRKGLFSKSIPLGTGIFIDMTTIDHRNVILLPTGDYDRHSSDVRHILQLQRLGSLSTDLGAEEEDPCPNSPSSSTTRSHSLHVPISPPNFGMTRDLISHNSSLFPAVPGSGGGTGQQERRSEVVPVPLWPPYILSYNSPGGENRVCEASFMHQVEPGSSIKSEHRELEQRRYTRDSGTPQGSGNTRMAGPLPHSFPRHSNNDMDSEWCSLNTLRRQDHASHPNTITVQVEVHEDGRAPAHNTTRSQSDEPTSTRTGATAEAGFEDESTKSLEVDDHELTQTTDDVDSTRNVGVVIDNFDTREQEEVERIAHSCESDCDGKISDKELRHDSEVNMEWTNRGADASSMEDILSPEYRQSLEEAFLMNHRYENQPQSVPEAALSLIQQTQLCLQRLNYLSVSYKMTGEYDNITLEAVKTFQRAYNHHAAQNSVRLPESGHLTSLTHRFLRQVYLLVYGSLVRIGLDKHLGENFDPMSTSPRDIALFRKCVSELQQTHNVKECQTGSMCSNTIEKVRQLLEAQKRRAINSY